MTPESYIHSAKAHIKRLIIQADHNRLDLDIFSAVKALDDLDAALLALHSMSRVNSIPLQLHPAPIWKRITERLKEFGRHAA